MIVDKIEHMGRYAHIIPQCEELAAFFKVGLEGLPKEQTEIAGTGYVFSPFAYTTKEPESARWETHHHHMDIHIILEGEEILDWIPAHHILESEEYVAERDVEFFSDKTEGSHILVEEGYFALVMPEDAHKPSLANRIPVQGKKAVIKGEAAR